MNIKSKLKKSTILRKIYPKYIDFKSKLRFLYMKMFSPVLTEEDLIKQLPLCGLVPGDKIVVNSSMSKIGMLKEGPRTLVNALKRYITEEGLIVMPTYPHRGMYEYLENYVMFDVNKTPSMNGAITEYFRNSDGVFRSAHPTHSLAIWGKNASEIASRHELSKSPYDEMSPYKKLLDMNVKNFCIGVNFNHMIMIRVIDDLDKNYPIMPYIPNKEYIVPVKLADGQIVEVKTPCHDPNYFGLERNNMKMFAYMKSYITFGHLGKAYTWVLSSQDMFKVQQDCASKGIFAFNKYRFKNEI